MPPISFNNRPSPSHVAKPSRAFKLTMVGFSPVQKSLVSGVCKLSNTRNVNTQNAHSSYCLVDFNEDQEADIYLLDVESPLSTQETLLDHVRQRNAPVITVSKEPKEATDGSSYNLVHNQLIRNLLGLLDQIVDRHLDEDVVSGVSRLVGSKKCLVVDDSRLVRAQMELILKEYALDVAFAEDAESALQMVKDNNFDVIFLDVMLPEMDGYKACKLIKSDPKTCHKPVVMLTSKRSPFNKMHGALVGCDRYLTKPVDADKVHETLTRYNVCSRKANDSVARKNI